MGTYVGMEDSLHLFRVHPKYICPGCGQGLFIIEIHCEEGHDVTAEFVKLSLSEGVKK
jgi:hypothetical protein